MPPKASFYAQLNWALAASNFKASELAAALQLPLQPLAVIGIGKPIESIFMVPASPGDSLDYYRKDGAHFVPKLQVKDLLL